MRLVLGVLLALVAPASGFAEEMLKVDVPPPAQVAPLDTSRVLPVSLVRIAIDIPEGTPWAQVRWTGALVGCGGGEVQRWQARHNSIGSDAELERIFRQELTAAGGKVSGDPTDLFAASAGAADLQVGALVTDMRVHECSEVAEGDEAKVGGLASMDIEWQVYSVSEAKVLARIRTRGGASLPKIVPGGAKLLLAQPFAENVRALTSNPEFRRIVTGAPPTTEAPALFAPIVISLGSASGKAPVSEATKGAVIIRAADGMGSGVLISSSGYILTNHHVVGDASRVRITWADQSESTGEVLRSDRARDVALIKTETVKGQPTPVRQRPVELGETVFAIGTPLDKAFQNTVTKGVVSGARTINGHAFIQSDAPVTHGNSGGPLVDGSGAIVGLTDWGVDPAAGSSLNFFIPIEDALKALGIAPTVAPAPDVSGVQRRGGRAQRARNAATP